MKFYACTNNGVTGIVRAEDYQLAVEVFGKRSLPKVRPTFTFSNFPYLRPWATGSLEEMEAVLTGHEVEKKQFYVPFSNGRQYGGDPNDPEVVLEWMSHTTIGEAMLAFGLFPVQKEVGNE